jgi:hypothetical protein
VTGGALVPEPVATIDVDAQAENGLLGMAPGSQIS